MCCERMWEPVHVGLEPNECLIASFSAKQWWMISEDFPNPNPQMGWQLHSDGSIWCPSTAYEGCQTPFICCERMCEPVHVGLEPQPMHNGFIQCKAVIDDVRRFPKSQHTNGLGTVWWWINIPIHSIWRMSNTFHMLGEIWELVYVGLERSKIHNCFN